MKKNNLKLENPLRLMELNPALTLEKIGFLEDQTLCDIGAGTGIFTIPGANITKEKVYALEISDDMLSIIKDKIMEKGLGNIQLVKVKDDSFDLPSSSIDLALMVTVLHEIEEKKNLLREVKRILKTEGRLAIIEFHKEKTPMGPPVDHRISKEETIEVLRDAGFREINSFDLGANFYCMVFIK